MVEALGPKLAAGRDSEIFEHGPGRVLRRSRDGRSLVGEAEVMSHARGLGYPVPEVFEAGSGYLVMERLVGPTMMDWMGSPPFPLRRGGRILADLHDRLHRIAAPAGISDSPLPGDRLLHLDLHPMNVVMTDDGPFVIDWANASAGDPDLDVAVAWILLACAAPDVQGLDRVIVPVGRRILLRSFLGAVDRAGARAAIPAAVDLRLGDANLSAVEHGRMRSIAAWASPT